MQQKVLNFTQIVISDIERTITLNMLEMFLRPYPIQILSKNKDLIYITFHTQQDAKTFIQEHNHKTQMLKRKFNIYYSFFQKVKEVVRLEVNGIEETKLRKAFEICSHYGPHRFQIAFNNNTIQHNCYFNFLHLDLDKDLKALKQSLAELDIKVRHEEAFGNANEFRCSIQLKNFIPIKDQSFTEEEETFMKEELNKFVMKATGQQPTFSQIMTYLHSLVEPRIKAYFQFATIEDTFLLFEKLRKYLLDLPSDLTCKLFYFQQETDTYQTLFMNGLLNPSQLPEKQFENQLVSIFRRVNPNITQITTKKKYSTHTAKIYFRDQQNGKSFLIDLGNSREILYPFFKPNSPIVANIFCTKKRLDLSTKIEKNTGRLMKQLKDRNETNRMPQGIVPIPQPRGRVQERGRAYKKKEGREEPKKYQKIKKKEPEQKKYLSKVEFSEEEFPSL